MSIKKLVSLNAHCGHVTIVNLCTFIDPFPSLIVDFGFRMWSSIKTLFWALFGEFDVSSFEAEPPEEAVGITILALWLVLAVIVLLNMLIALISNSFQRVQVYWNDIN